MSIPVNSPAGPIRLVSVQRLAAGGRWRTEAMRSLREPVLLWFTRGAGRITVAGLTRGYGAHNAIFIPGGTMHGFEVTGQTFGTAVFFGAAGEFGLPEDPCHLRVREARRQTELTGLLETLQREAEGERPLRDRAMVHLAGLLAVWLGRQRQESEDRPGESAARDLVRRYTQAIEQELHTGRSVGDYAEALGVTPTHLSRVCNATCGRPASEILADRLTFEARRLLDDTALPVKRVAEILGFGSAAYFTRAFHHRTGQTPTEFRRGRRR